MQSLGEFIQLRLYFSDDQMVDYDVIQSGIEIHAMVFHANPTQEL